MCETSLIMSRVLVTGGAGFIGSNVSEGLMKQGREVVILDNLSTGKEKNIPEGAELVNGSILDEDLVRKLTKDVDVVFHLAAQASVILGVEKPYFDLENNVKGGLVLLNAMVENGVKRIVFPSSSTVYGKQDSLPMEESMFPRPVSPYAVGKLSMEGYLNCYMDVHGIEPVSFRIFNAFGPRQDLENGKQGITGFIIGRLLKGEPFPVHGKGDQTRDYIFIDDIVEAFMRAETSKSGVGRVMNLAVGRQTSLVDWIKLIGEVMGVEPELSFKQGYRMGDVMHYRADISRLKDTLEMEPSADLRKGLEKTIEWARGV